MAHLLDIRGRLLALAALLLVACFAPAVVKFQGIACRTVHLQYPGPAGTAFSPATPSDENTDSGIPMVPMNG